MPDKAYTIARMTADQWAVLRDIRLRALKLDPGVFGSNFAAESNKTPEEWMAWLTDPNVAIFCLWYDDTPIGITGVAIYRDDPSRKTAILWGSWLDSAHRKKGLSEHMYRARIAWAEQHPGVEQIIVSHRQSNIASGRANQKHGFVFTHARMKTWPDGAEEQELFYQRLVGSKSMGS